MPPSPPAGAPQAPIFARKWLISLKISDFFVFMINIQQVARIDIEIFGLSSTSNLISPSLSQSTHYDFLPNEVTTIRTPFLKR